MKHYWWTLSDIDRWWRWWQDIDGNYYDDDELPIWQRNEVLLCYTRVKARY